MAVEDALQAVDAAAPITGVPPIAPKIDETGKRIVSSMVKSGEESADKIGEFIAERRSKMSGQESQKDRAFNDLRERVAATNKDKTEKQADLKAEYGGVAPQMPSTEAPKPSKKELSDFGKILLVMGALGGKKSGDHFTSALNNMTAVIQGEAQGQDEQAAQHKQEFEENFKRGKESFDEYHKKLTDILNEHKGDTASLMNEARILALQYGDARLYEAASNHDINGVVSSAKIMEITSKDAIAGLEKIKSGTGQYTPEGLDFATKAVQAGLKAALPTGQRGVPQYEVINNIAHQAKLSGYDPVEVLSNAKVAQQVLRDITKRESFVKDIQYQIEKQGQNVISLGEAIPDPEIRGLKASVLKTEAYMGNPKVARYITQIHVLQREVARLANPASGAQMSVHSMEQAEKIVNYDFTVDQLKEIVAAFEFDAKTAHDSMTAVKDGLSESVTNRKNQPATDQTGNTNKQPKGGDRRHIFEEQIALEKAKTTDNSIPPEKRVIAQNNVKLLESELAKLPSAPSSSPAKKPTVSGW